MRVADRDGGVARLALLHQHIGQGLSYDIATTHDDDVGTLQGDIATNQQLYHPMGCAGQKGLLAHDHAPHVHRMETIDIFVWIHRQQDLGFVDVWRQGQLHQNAVDLRIFVHLLDQRYQGLLSGIRRQTVVIRENADFAAGAFFRGHIGSRGRIVPNQNHTQTGDNAPVLQVTHLLLKFVPHVGGHLPTIDDPCCHSHLPVTALFLSHQ